MTEKNIENTATFKSPTIQRTISSHSRVSTWNFTYPGRNKSHGVSKLGFAFEAAYYYLFWKPHANKCSWVHRTNGADCPFETVIFRKVEGSLAQNRIGAEKRRTHVCVQSSGALERCQ